MSIPAPSSCSTLSSYVSDDWDTWYSDGEDDQFNSPETSRRGRGCSLICDNVPDIPAPFEGPRGTTPKCLGSQSLSSFPLCDCDNVKLFELAQPPVVEKFNLPSAFSFMTLVHDSGTMRFYEAVCLGSDERVAVKRVRNREDTDIQSFVDNEVYLALSCADCPNAVRTISCHRTPYSTWTVMEYIDGPNFKQLIRDTGVLKLSHVAFVVKQLLIALQWMHCRDRCHRDVKGENLLVNKATGEIFLCDFGWAVQFTEERPTTSESVGTVLFMAPEVLRGNQYGTEIDIWSVGVLVHELCDCIPHEDQPIDQAIRDIVTKPPPTLFDDAGEDAIEFAASCMTKDPSDRPTVDQLMCSSFIKSACSSEEWKAEVECRVEKLESQFGF